MPSTDDRSCVRCHQIMEPGDAVERATMGFAHRACIVERDPWPSFGAAIRLARKGSGLTMGDVARRLGVRIAVVSALEMGEDPE